MYEPMTVEKLMLLDKNEMKVRTILKMLLMLGADDLPEGIDIISAIEAAYDCLEANNQILSVSI